MALKPKKTNGEGDGLTKKKTELEEYREAAIYRAQNRIDLRILNSSRDHAHALIHAMLCYARPEDRVVIYSGGLPEGIFSDLTNSRAKLIEILVDDDSGLGWLDKIESSDRKLRIKKITKQRDNHFLATSAGFFRFETNRSTFEAEANFNEPRQSDELLKAFDRYSEDASEVRI